MWTDDTEIAASVYREVVRHGEMDADRLAASFADDTVAAAERAAVSARITHTHPEAVNGAVAVAVAAALVARGETEAPGTFLAGRSTTCPRGRCGGGCTPRGPC